MILEGTAMEFITEEDREKLQAQLKALIEHRPVISERIAEARALGDLKENAEDHAAREQQGLEEAEIRRIEERLASAQVVDATKQADGVVFVGSIVRLKDLKRGDDDTYRLVGELSGNPLAEPTDQACGHGRCDQPDSPAVTGRYCAAAAPCAPGQRTGNARFDYARSPDGVTDGQLA